MTSSSNEHLRAVSSTPADRHFRRAPFWHAVSLCLVAVALLILGCGSPARPTSDVQVEMTLQPSPATVGDAQVRLRLIDAEGKPLEHAQVQLEGNMNHAGMKPSFAEVSEVAPGEYAGTLEFTMAGDWFVLVTAITSDGEIVERKIDVPGVQVP